VAVSQNLETLRRGHEAFNRGDFSVVREIVTDDVRWGTTGTFAGLDPLYVGAEAFVEWGQDVRSVWESFEVAVEDVLHEEGDKLLVAERLSGRGRQSGAEVDMRAFSVYEFSGGRIAARRAFTEERAAREAAGVG
jgi:ketosteroid isomerase-like protein